VSEKIKVAINLNLKSLKVEERLGNKTVLSCLLNRVVSVISQTWCGRQ